MKKMSMVLVLAILSTAAQAAEILATANGVINAAATWGGKATPGAPDANTWNTNGFNLSFTTETFFGGTLLVGGSSNLEPIPSGRTLTLQAATFDGGRMWHSRNGTSDFSNKALTIGSGGLDSRAANSGKIINLNNGVWAGSGNINYYRGGPDGPATASLTLQSGNDMAGYTGTISAGVTGPNDAVLLTIEAATTGTFGVNIGGVSTLTVSGASNYHFSSLTLGADTIPPGIVYSFGDFTPTQQGFLSAAFTGTISVGTIPAGTVIRFR
jgi:hypothetical protein